MRASLIPILTAFNPLSLFAGGTYAGFLYDNLNLGNGYIFTDTAGTTPVTADADTVALLKDRSPNSTNASQSTSGSRPQWKTGGTPYLLFDGVDDLLTTTFLGGSAATLAVCGRAGGDGQFFSCAVDNGGAKRLGVGYSASQVVGQWGSDIQTTIKGGTTSAGVDLVVLLRGNSATVDLWLNGARVYNAAANGSAGPTVNSLHIGALNNNGTPNSFLAGRGHRAFAINRVIPDQAVVPLMRWLGRGLVSF